MQTFRSSRRAVLNNSRTSQMGVACRTHTIREHISITHYTLSAIRSVFYTCTDTFFIPSTSSNTQQTPTTKENKFMNTKKKKTVNGK